MSAEVRYGVKGSAEEHVGPVVVGSILYDSKYLTPPGGGTVSGKQLTRVGPGWQNYRTLDRSTYKDRITEWSIDLEGTMDRRTVKTDSGRIYRHHDGWQSHFRKA
jgi:hypothetical protein